MKIKYTDIPTDWPLCFLAQCARKDTCLRYQAALALPQTVETCVAVAPTVLQKAKCPQFCKIKVMRTALGFTRIFSEVKQRHVPEIRARIAAYLGGNGTYYRYLHGECALTPEQQQWIRDLFDSFGYTDGIAFDGYEEGFCFYNT